MRGRLIYEMTGELRAFDLDKRTDHRLMEWPHIGTAISVVDSNTLLVDTGYTNPEEIFRLDLTSLETVKVVAGVRPKYVPHHNRIFYRRGQIYEADLNDPLRTERTVADGETSYTYVIPVSPDEVVFEIRGDAGKTPPSRYNLVTGKLDRLPFSERCTPYIWRSFSEQLLCGIDGTETYYLIGLDGRHRTEIDFFGQTRKSRWPLLYIPAFDVLIFGAVRMVWIGKGMGEHFDLWAFHFKTGHREKLLDDNAPGQGGIVWVE